MVWRFGCGVLLWRDFAHEVWDMVLGKMLIGLGFVIEFCFGFFSGLMRLDFVEDVNHEGCAFGIDLDLHLPLLEIVQLEVVVPE